MSTSPPPDELPFGRTSTTVEEVERFVDRPVAREVLFSNGVENPDAAITAVVTVIPGLLEWLAANGRRYPWRETTDPWRVYLSEILLQRTRADAVEDIYDKFFARFPNPKALREASDEAIYETVETLGFGNHRTRTLREVADMLGADHNDTVPCSLTELQRPWRVGPYSARATMLFAFGKPMALVDTNFARITARLFEYELPSQPHKSDEIYRLLETLIPTDPGLCRAMNLALLDLADEVCTPSDPLCKTCPLRGGCRYPDSDSWKHR